MHLNFICRHRKFLACIKSRWTDKICSPSLGCLSRKSTSTSPMISHHYCHTQSAEVERSQSNSESAASAAGASLFANGSRGPYVSRLASRGVIRFDGPETIAFLQGLVTNDMRRFEENPAPPSSASTPTVNAPTTGHSPLYTALLNPQGRFLFDLFCYRPRHADERLSRDGSAPGGDGRDAPELLADVDVTFVDEILALLKKHRLRAKVSFEDASNDIDVWVRYAGLLKAHPEAPQEEEAGGIGYGGTNDISAKASVQASENGWSWYKDPRLAELGLRGLFPKGTTPPLVESQEEVGEEYYKIWRYDHGVAEGNSEIPKGEALPLEYNLDGLNAISFDKGCYVGQELTARTHYRGVVRKRLMPVYLTSPFHDEETPKTPIPAEVVESDSGKKVGKVVAAVGSRGLAHLRLNSALKNSAVLRINHEDSCIVRPNKPAWWPSEWLLEIDGDSKEVPANEQ